MHKVPLDGTPLVRERLSGGAGATLIGGESCIAGHVQNSEYYAGECWGIWFCGLARNVRPLKYWKSPIRYVMKLVLYGYQKTQPLLL